MILPVNIARLGARDALYDTGANCSIIKLSAAEGLTIRRTEGLDYILGAGGVKIAIIGETSMTVRFRNSVVDLKRVRVMEDCSFDVILGLDWISRSGVLPVIRDKQMVGFKTPSLVPHFEKKDRQSGPEEEALPTPSQCVEKPFEEEEQNDDGLIDDVAHLDSSDLDLDLVCSEPVVTAAETKSRQVVDGSSVRHLLGSVPIEGEPFDVVAALDTRLICVNEMSQLIQCLQEVAKKEIYEQSLEVSPTDDKRLEMDMSISFDQPVDLASNEKMTRSFRSSILSKPWDPGKLAAIRLLQKHRLRERRQKR